MRHIHVTKKRVILICAAATVIVAAILWEVLKKPTNIYKVKRENFEAIISCKGEIQSEKAVLITIPDIFGDRSLEIYDSKITDLIPEGSIVKKGDYVALLDQGRIKELKEANMEVLKKVIFNFNDAKIDSAVDLVALRDGIDQFGFDLENKKLEMEQSVFESPAFQRKAQMMYERTARQLEEKKRAYQLTKKSFRIRLTRNETYLNKLTEKDTRYQIAFDAARITAPKDGMLIYGRTYGRGGSRKLTINSWVSMQNPTIATLPDLTFLASETFIEEIYISKIKVGDSVRVYIDALKNVAKTGIISAISNVGQEMTGFDSKVFKVIIRIASDKNRIKPAMTTNNEIIIAREENVLVIPRSALVFIDGKQFVYMPKFGKLELKQVITGNKNEKSIIIKSGLKEGDKIVMTKPEIKQN